LVWISEEGTEGVSVELIKTVPGSYPEESFLVLDDAIDRILGESFFNADILGGDIFDPKLLGVATRCEAKE